MFRVCGHGECTSMRHHGNDGVSRLFGCAIQLLANVSASDWIQSDQIECVCERWGKPKRQHAFMRVSNLQSRYDNSVALSTLTYPLHVRLCLFRFCLVCIFVVAWSLCLMALHGICDITGEGTQSDCTRGSRSSRPACTLFPVPGRKKTRKRRKDRKITNERCLSLKGMEGGRT